MSKFLEQFDPEGPNLDPREPFDPKDPKEPFDPKDPGDPAPTIFSSSASPSSVTVSSSNPYGSVNIVVEVDGADRVEVDGITAKPLSRFEWVAEVEVYYKNYYEGSNPVGVGVVASNRFGETFSIVRFTVVRDADADTTPPFISSFTVNDSTVTLTTSSQSQTVTFTGVASDSGGISLYGVNNGATPSFRSGNNYYFTKTFNYSSYGWGTTTTVFTFTVTDNAGNRSTATRTVYITKIDNQAPTISSFTVNDSTVTLNNTNSTSQTVTFTANMTDNRGITSKSVNNGATFSSQVGTNYYFTKTFNYSSYAEGSTTTTFTLTASDAAGNTSTATRNVTITRNTSDVTAPFVGNPTLSDPNPIVYASINSKSTNVNVQVTDAGGVASVSAFSSILGSLPMVFAYSGYYNFNATYWYSGLELGSTNDTITVTAADNAGNLASKSVVANVTARDDVAPSITSFSRTASTVNLYTTSQSQTVTFTAVITDNESVNSYSLSNASFVGKSGNTYTWSKTYKYNDYSWGSTNVTHTLSASDAAGNLTTSSLTNTIVKIDNQSPSISSFTVNDSTVSLSTSSQSQTVTFTGVITDNRGVTGYSVNNGAAFSSKSGNNYYFTKTFNYADYSFGTTSTTFTLTARDAAGNSSTYGRSVSITKTDNQNPTISSFTVSDSTITLTTSSQSQTVSFNATVSDNVGVTSASVPGTTAVDTSGSTRSWSKTFSYGDYSFGTTSQTYTLTVTDAAGNSTTSSRTVTITKTDNQSPTITSFLANDTTVNLTTSSPTQTITYSASVSDNVAVTSAVVSGLTYTGYSGGKYHWTKTFNYADYSFGTTNYTRVLVVSDAAGNSTTRNETVSVTKTDNQAPTISSFTANDTSVTLTTSSQTQTVTYTAVITDNVGVSSVSVPGATYVGQSGNTYTWTKTFSYGSYGFGTSYNTLTLTASDSAGNTRSLSETVSITKTDNQAPIIESFSANYTNVKVRTSAQSQTITFTANLSDNVAITSHSVTGASFVSSSSGIYIYSRTYNYADYSYGTTNETVTLTVGDSAGNTSTSSLGISVTKTDNQNPTISSFTVSDSTVVLTTSSQSQTISFKATVSDNVAVSSASVPGTTAVDTSGSTRSWSKTFSYNDFPFGTTSQTYTLTVTDSTGNSTSSSVNLTVTKTDTQSPSISNFSVSDSTISLSTSSQSQAVTFSATITDNVSVSSVSLPGATYLGASGNVYTWSKTFGYGSYSFGTTSQSFTVTALDAAGNSKSSTLSLSVSKIDDEDPNISSFRASDTTVVLTTSSPTQTITYTAVVTDNRGVSSIVFPDGVYTGVSGTSYTWSRTFSYNDYSFGTTSVSGSVTATDAAGNHDGMSETVTVTKSDDQSPAISSLTVNDSTVTLLTSSQSQTLTFTAVLSDNVAITSYSLSGATFTSSSGSNYYFTKTYNYSSYGFGATSDTLTLTVSDAAGNTSVDAITVSITKTDDQNPTISSFTVSDSTVTLLTDSQSQTVTFNATISDNVGVTSVSLPGATAVDTSGSTRSWTKTFNYADYSFGTTSESYTLTITDAQGNRSSSNVSLTITKSDNQSPSISRFSVNDSTVSLTTSSQSQTVTFTLTASDNVGVSSKSVSNGASFSSQSGSNYYFTKTFTYGSYSYGNTSETFIASVYDAAGNVSSSSVSVTVTKTDNQNPSIKVFSANSSGTIIDSNWPTPWLDTEAWGTSLGNLYHYGENVMFVIDATMPSSISNGCLFEAGTSSVGTFLGIVSSRLRFTSGDGATGGNESDHDTAVMSIPLPNDRVPLDGQVHEIAGFIYADTGTIRLYIDGDLVGQAESTTGTFESNNWQSGNAAGFGVYSGSVASGGTQTPWPAGSSGRLRIWEWTESNGMEVDDDSVIVALSASSPSKTISFTASATDNVALSTVSAVGLTYKDFVSDVYRWEKTFNYSDYGVGTAIEAYTVTAVDTTNNAAAKNITVQIVGKDTVSPVISSFSTNISVVNLTTSSQSRTVTFTLVATDNVSISSVSLPGATYGGVSGSTYTWSKTFSYSSYGWGNTSEVYTVTVSDSAGNTTTSNVTLTISKSDTQAPKISSFTASDTTVGLTTSSQSVNITLTAVITDNRGVTSYSVPGATFQGVSGNSYTWAATLSYADYSFGTSTKSYLLTASDAAGNSSTLTETVSVTKTDDQAPTITSFFVSPSSLAVTTSNQSATATFTAVASDNVSISSISLPGASYVGQSGNTYTWTKTVSYSDYSWGSTSTTYSLTAQDSAGNTSTANTSLTVTKSDTQAPTISNVSVSDSTVNVTTSGQTQTITVSADITDNRGVSSYSATGATFLQRVGNTYSWTRTFSYGDYGFGTTGETITVSATDAAGNYASDSVDITVTKSDNQSPTISSFTASASTVSLTTSSQSATITLYATISDNVAVSSASVPGTATIDTTGSTRSWKTSFSYGSYSFGSTVVPFTLTVTDSAGNTTTSSLNITVNKSDDQAPTISSFSLSSSSITLSTSSPSQSITMQGTISDNVSIASASTTGGALVTVSGSTYVWSRTFSYSSYSFGTTTETITLTVTDGAGNTSTSTESLSVVKVDNEDPNITSFTVSPTSVSLTTSSQTKTVTYTAVMTDNRGITSYTLPGATFVSQSGSTYTWTRTFNYSDYSFGSSTTTAILTAYDAAGNSDVGTATVTVSKTDDQSPTISSFTVDSASIGVTTSQPTETVQFTAVISDNVAISSYSVSGATFVQSVGNSYTFNRTYSYGDYGFGTTVQSVILSVTDAAGNTSASSLNVSVTKTDDQSPSISSFTSSATRVNLTSSNQAAAITFSATISDNVAVQSATISGATGVDTTGSSRTWSKSFQYGSYSYGSTLETYTLVVTDAAGNSRYSSINITIVKTDDQNPSITSFTSSVSSVALTTGSAPQTVTFTLVATDNRGITSVSLPGASYQGSSGSTYTWTKLYDYDHYSFGSTADSLTVTAIDAAGNSATDNVVVTITKTDTQSPTISSFAPSQASLELGSGDSATITFTAVASDNVGVDQYALTTPSEIVTNPSVSGSTYTWTKTINASSFNDGQNTEIYTVEFTDSAGNTQTSTVNLSVFVFNYTMMTTSTMNYIAITANINKNVTVDGSNYGLTGGAFDIGRAHEFKASYNLPKGSISFPMGEVTAQLPNMVSGGTFTPVVEITVDLEGNLSANVQISGASVTHTATEDVDKAQVVAWSTESTPNVSSTTQDVLSSTVTSTDIYNHFSAEIDAIEQAYSHNVLQFWSMEITNIEARSTSVITQYAINNGRQHTNIFMEGEQIVLDTTYPYSVKVTDLNGEEQVIVGKTPIYAIVTHSDGAPPLV